MERYFEDAASDIVKANYDLLISKQLDYGPENIMASPFGPERGLIVRLWDKIARLANLYERGVEPNHESLEDTWRDISNYGTIGLMVARGEFRLPLANLEARKGKDIVELPKGGASTAPTATPGYLPDRQSSQFRSPCLGEFASITNDC